MVLTIVCKGAALVNGCAITVRSGALYMSSAHHAIPFPISFCTQLVPAIHHPHTNTQPVNAEDMHAFDTLPDEASVDVRKEARYLAYVVVTQFVHKRPVATVIHLRTTGRISTGRQNCVLIPCFLGTTGATTILFLAWACLQRCVLFVFVPSFGPSTGQHTDYNSAQGFVLFSNGNLKSLYKQVVLSAIVSKHTCSSAHDPP